MKNSIFFTLGLVIAILIGCNTPNAGRPLTPIKPNFKGASSITKIETHEVPHFSKTLSASTEREVREALTNKYAELAMRDAVENLKKIKPYAPVPALPPMPPAFLDTPEYTNQMLALEAEILKRTKRTKEEASVTVNKEGIITLLPANKVEAVKEVSKKSAVPKLILYYTICAALGLLGWFGYRFIAKMKAKKTPTAS